MAATMYKRVLLVRMIPKLPIENENIYKSKKNVRLNAEVDITALTLSSSEEKPKYELSLTSFRHLAHLWMAVLVKLTRNGIKIRLKIPNRSIDRNVSRYPNRLG